MSDSDSDSDYLELFSEPLPDIYEVTTPLQPSQAPTRVPTRPQKVAPVKTQRRTILLTTLPKENRAPSHVNKLKSWKPKKKPTRPAQARPAPSPVRRRPVLKKKPPKPEFFTRESVVLPQLGIRMEAPPRPRPPSVSPPRSSSPPPMLEKGPRLSLEVPTGFEAAFSEEDEPFPNAPFHEVSRSNAYQPRTKPNRAWVKKQSVKRIKRSQKRACEFFAKKRLSQLKPAKPETMQVPDLESEKEQPKPGQPGVSGASDIESEEDFSS